MCKDNYTIYFYPFNEEKMFNSVHIESTNVVSLLLSDAEVSKFLIYYYYFSVSTAKSFHL